MSEQPYSETAIARQEMNIVVWACTKCYDYGKVFQSGAKNFCGKCGGKLVTRNFTVSWNPMNPE